MAVQHCLIESDRVFGVSYALSSAQPLVSLLYCLARHSRGTVYDTDNCPAVQIVRKSTDKRSSSQANSEVPQERASRHDNGAA